MKNDAKKQSFNLPQYINEEKGNYQGAHGSWKTWKVLESYFDILQDWEVLEKDYRFWKVMEIC